MDDQLGPRVRRDGWARDLAVGMMMGGLFKDAGFALVIVFLMALVTCGALTWFEILTLP